MTKGKSGIISRRGLPSAWSHQLVVVEKANGSLRLCLDPSALNMYLKDEHFRIPTLDDFCDTMSGFKYFSVFDLKEGVLATRIMPRIKRIDCF